MAVTPDHRQAANAWLARDPDAQTRAKLQHALDQNDEQALQQAFGDRLAFGTAGLRGLLGFGPNNMNRVVVRETTAGLADYLNEARPEPGETQRVVIAHDARHGSHEFARDAAGILAAKGIKVLFYESLAPTPLCGFAVRQLGTAAGIVVTASHNPPQYNGYKVYHYGGTQINDPVDGLISAKIDAVAKLIELPQCLSLDEARAFGHVEMIGKEMFDRYIQATLVAVPPFDLNENKEQPIRGQNTASKESFPIAYTPLHGVGAPIAQALLRQRGFSEVWTVAEQEQPDGNFPTVEFPNPEEPGATDLLMALADKHGAPIAIANDPDADRLCICARNSQGKMQQMTGDHLGSLLGDALMQRWLRMKSPKQLGVRSTIVSSRILARLARLYGIEHRETLTGFKWIGPAAERIVKNGKAFVFGYEEALGYMVNDVVLDKDGLSGLLAITELAYALHQKGQTLWDRLEEIHAKVGLSITMQRTIKLKPGMSGSAIMKRLRAENRREIDQYGIALTDDLLKNPPKSEAGPEDIPRNDVLRYYVATPGSQGTGVDEIKLTQPRIIVRPSGTEPKVKIYCELLGSIGTSETYQSASDKATQELTAIVDAFHAWMSNDGTYRKSSHRASHQNVDHRSGTRTFGQSSTTGTKWISQLISRFPLMTTSAVDRVSPARENRRSKPILFVAEGHPSRTTSKIAGPSSTGVSWASSDPRCLISQMQLIFRGIDFDCEQVNSKIFGADKSGEGFADVPMLLDVDGTIIGRQHLLQWADAVQPLPDDASQSSNSDNGKLLESLLRGPLLAGVLLEIALLPETSHLSIENPFFTRHLQKSLASEKRRRLVAHIATLRQEGPTNRVPGWITSFYGLLGDGSASLTDTGKAATSWGYDDIQEKAVSSLSRNTSDLNVASIQREAGEAIEALSISLQDSAWLSGDRWPTDLDAYLFAMLHTIMSLPVGAEAPLRLKVEHAPNLVGWTRKVWREFVKPRGG